MCFFYLLKCTEISLVSFTFYGCAFVPPFYLCMNWLICCAMCPFFLCTPCVCHVELWAAIYEWGYINCLSTWQWLWQLDWEKLISIAQCLLLTIPFCSTSRSLGSSVEGTGPHQIQVLKGSLLYLKRFLAKSDGMLLGNVPECL